MNLKNMPFNLTDEDIQWVEKTLAGMDAEQKLGQLFCLIGYSSDEEFLKDVAKRYQPGGLMCRPMTAAEVLQSVATLQNNSAIPMLISANLEKGGNGIAQEGTMIGSPMQVAATHEDDMARKLGEICGREGAAVGANWAFAPIIDIDYNFRNPITNTRTFGSDPDRVRRLGVEYVKAVQSHGVAASIKHFPGDGVDERDQHLVTSVNTLSCEQWDETYGEAYKASIEAGALSAMIGHISLPAYSKAINPALTDEQVLPASLSHELVTGLLRGKLGFEGLIVTDATTMAGMTIPMSREQAVPQTIAAGCDMFLFTRNMDEDYGYMRKGIENGTITPQRLDEAITRILAMKAALGLHKKSNVPSLDEALKVLGCDQHKAWAEECADKAVTLVKQQPGVLPLSTKKYPRVLYYPIESEQGVAYSVKAGVADEFLELLKKEGFQIDTFDAAKGMEGNVKPYSDVTDHYDLIVYLANMATKSNQTTVRIEWAQPMGANVPIFGETVPTIFVSVENPYHLLDVPRVKNFINGYSSTPQVLQAIVDKLMGRSDFKGKNPMDPFLGMWDTRL